MKKAIALGIVIAMVAVMLTGCIPKEIRTVKIELGTFNKPKPNPDIDRVKENLDKAVKMYPDNPEVYHLWGRVYSMEDNYVEMDKAFNKSEELSPKFKAVNDTIRMIEWKDLVDKATEAAQRDDFETALASFKNSIICWKLRFEPYMYGSDAAYQIGRKEEAYEMAKKAYELAPDTLRVAQLYADMCMVNDKYDEADAVYQKLVEKDPTNAQMLFHLADIYRAKDDTSKAIGFYRRALEIDGDNSDGWFNLGLLYFQAKDFCNAAECFGRVTSLIPEDIDAKINYLLSLVQCGELETARTELEKFTMENPDNCDGWDLLSQTYLRLKMKKEASEAYKKFEECQGK